MVPSTIPICPKCEKAAWKSCVFEHASSTTCMGGASTFRDEDGKHHIHDPNWTTTTYRCSLNHVFQVASKKPCPSCSVDPTPSLDPNCSTLTASDLKIDGIFEGQSYVEPYAERVYSTFKV